MELINFIKFSSLIDSTYLLFIYFVFFVSAAKIFIKAGVTWWYALIPVVNIFYLAKIARFPFVFLFVPFFLLVAFMFILAQADFFAKEFNFFGVLIFAAIAIFVFFAITSIVFLLLHIHLARRFGKSGWFGLGLSVLPWFFYPVLAFDESTYLQEDTQTKQEPVIPPSAVTQQPESTTVTSSEENKTTTV